jgi:Ca2+-binding EF-hand superfamily protein
LDENKDGVVTKEELKRLIKGLGGGAECIIEEMISLADIDGDG